MSCLARLTSWTDKTVTQFGPGSRASTVKLCKNVPSSGILCDECMHRPVDGKYQVQIRHGLLTEPPVFESRIYGSPWFWIRMNKLGDSATIDPKWLLTALKAQAAAEKHCKAAGYDPWKVQRPSSLDLEEMKQRKKEIAALVKPPGLLEKFPIIKVLYEESEKPLEKMETDTTTVKKGDINGDPVWISESGLVFDCNNIGAIGEFIGRMTDGKFVAIG